ncbi:hypothetical protein PG984_010256 [Apiospora sp. TS-2023a]
MATEISDAPESYGHIRKVRPVALIGETPNTLIDVAMVSLAIVMIRSLQLPRSTKLKLQVLFGLGIS